MIGHNISGALQGTQVGHLWRYAISAHILLLIFMLNQIIFSEVSTVHVMHNFPSLNDKIIKLGQYIRRCNFFTLNFHSHIIESSNVYYMIPYI